VTKSGPSGGARQGRPGILLLIFAAIGALAASPVPPAAAPMADPPTAASASEPPAASLAPPAGIVISDKPLDAGRALKIVFARSPGDSLGHGPVARYEILRKGPADTGFVSIKSFNALQRSTGFSFDDTGLRPGKPYSYIVRALGRGGSAAATPPTEPTAPERQWFFTNKINTLVAVVLFVGIILGFIHAARRGKDLFIRRIAGMDAIDEAVGRCTEMGKPTLYIPGMSTISDVATIASLNILGQVSKRIATYQSRILVPIRDPIVFPIAQDVVRTGFAEAGYADSYRKEDVYFITHDQFAYAAAVCGTMAREKPGANLLLGMFYAEALILAETGNSVGAIQIAGTDAVSQLPFFVTACDYTIIGEELYAASAYISREPSLLGSLKGQDIYKLLLIVLIVIGVLSATAGILVRGEPYDWLRVLLRTRGSGG
jgi:hypothetical protein